MNYISHPSHRYNPITGKEMTQLITKPMGPKDLTGANIKIMVWFTAHICANWSQFK